MTLYRLFVALLLSLGLIASMPDFNEIGNQIDPDGVAHEIGNQIDPNG